LDTTTSTDPLACEAVVAIIAVLLTTFTFVAGVPPRVRVAPARKPVPVTVTFVPQFDIPALGVIAVTVGAGFDAGA
jgi:hypothetical protein